MSCSQTLSGIAKDCTGNMGGIKRVLIANAADIDAVTITSDEVTAITMVTSGTPPVAAKFVEFYFRPNTSNMTSTWQVNNENGTNYVQTLLQMVFNRMETSKRVAIMALAQAEVVAIVEDMNGKYWYLGYDNPMFLNAGDGPTGTARADRNGYSITLEDNSKALPYEVDDAIISGLL